MVVLSARDFTWIFISDILVFVRSFRYWRRSCYFKAYSPRLGSTTWWIPPSGIVISRLILRALEDYRSSYLLEEDYQGPCLLVEDYQGSCLLLEDYRGFYLLVGGLSSFLLVWLALQVLLLAAEGGFN